MPGQTLRLGPFIGGLNLASDPTTIADNELISCINLELDLDGSLKERPPIQTSTLPNVHGERTRAIGSAVFASTTYLFGENNGATMAFNPATAVWTTLSTTFIAADCIQYGGLVYFLSYPGGSAASNSLATWDGTTWAELSTPNLTTMIPGKGGQDLTIYKERMWISNGELATHTSARVCFSDAGNPGSFSTTTQFIDVGAGDGENLVNSMVYQDNLILFKEHSTYALSYDTRPTDATLIKLSNTVGATEKNCVISFENSIFVFHKDKVYEMAGNFDFQCINIKVPFVLDTTISSGSWYEGVSLWTFGDRLLCRYFNHLYVYGLRTKTWGEWQYNDADANRIGPMVARPYLGLAELTNTVKEWYGSTANSTGTTWYKMKDGFTTDVEMSGTSGSTNGTIIIPSFITKTYDLASAQSYKRLNWWGVDCIPGIPDGVTFTTMSGIVTPISASGTPVAITTTIAVSSLARRFLKFPKSLRYRQIFFQCIFSNVGSSAKAPVKIFSITAVTSTKELTEKAIN